MDQTIRDRSLCNATIPLWLGVWDFLVFYRSSCPLSDQTMGKVWIGSTNRWFNLVPHLPSLCLRQLRISMKSVLWVVITEQLTKGKHRINRTKAISWSSQDVHDLIYLCSMEIISMAPHRLELLNKPYKLTIITGVETSTIFLPTSKILNQK